MRILFIAPYPAFESPSQRYRFEQYFADLDEAGVKYEFQSFWSKSTWDILFRQGQWGRKISGLVSGFIRRWGLMTRLRPFDYIYLHREAAPVGPPVFEWIIAKIWRKRIIYDFDDAIWIPVISDQNRIALQIKWFGKIKQICRWSYKVSVGNEFLGDFARRYCNHVVLVPTVVDTDLAHNRLKNQESGDIVVGWTGSFSTLKFLHMLLPTLQKLQEKIDFEFLVIADRDPALPLKKYRFIRWKKDTEIDDLLQMNIGVMPLTDDELSKGKCGFKAIQYMSLGVPALVSPVGVNTKIVDHAVNGFVCHTAGEWEQYLTELILSAEKRRRIGQEARKKIENFYSVKATRALFLNIFKD